MWFVIGLLVGWLVPRPAVIGAIERKIWEPIKDKYPECRKWFG
jgi:hypothetical protein